MLRTHGNTTVLVSVLSVLIIILLTASGMGGGKGPETLTAFAGTGDPTAAKETAEELLAEEYNKQAGQETDRLPVSEEEDGPKKLSGNLPKTIEKKIQGRDPGERLEEKKRETPFSGKPSLSMDREDDQVLLKIVEAEAGICDDKGKILVANVVLNRVRSEEFPDTVREVVYQPSQFSPVSNGTINSCQVTEETVESVGRALAGEDYSQGALYFMNRGASRNSAVRWFDGRLKFLFRYEGHEFFK